MKKVMIVTDSSATVPAELAKELDIRTVPILLNLNGHSFRDGQDLHAGDVYRWLRESKKMPTTSAPSVGDFLRVYASAAREAAGIVSIHVSSELSGTCSAATAASTLIDGLAIRIVSCQSAAMGQGFVVIEAARAAQAGADLDTVEARAQQVGAKMNLLATIGTLKYLHRGGRIGGAAALLGSILQIKPVLYVADGHVDVFARPRTQAKAVRVMLEQMARKVDGCRVHAAVLHADVPEEAEAFRRQIEDRFDCAELLVAELTPVMGAHTGPGVLGVVFYADKGLPTIGKEAA